MSSLVIFHQSFKFLFIALMKALPSSQKIRIFQSLSGSVKKKKKKIFFEKLCSVW